MSQNRAFLCYVGKYFFLLCIINVFLWAETVNTVMSRSVRGLGLNAQCASGGIHTLLYIDGAASLREPGRAP